MHWGFSTFVWYFITFTNNWNKYYWDCPFSIFDAPLLNGCTFCLDLSVFERKRSHIRELQRGFLCPPLRLWRKIKLQDCFVSQPVLYFYQQSILLNKYCIQPSHASLLITWSHLPTAQTAFSSSRVFSPDLVFSLKAAAQLVSKKRAGVVSETKVFSQKTVILPFFFFLHAFCVFIYFLSKLWIYWCFTAYSLHCPFMQINTLTVMFCTVVSIFIFLKNINICGYSDDEYSRSKTSFYL